MSAKLDYNVPVPGGFCFTPVLVIQAQANEDAYQFERGWFLIKQQSVKNNCFNEYNHFANEVIAVVT